MPQRDRVLRGGGGAPCASPQAGRNDRLHHDARVPQMQLPRQRLRPVTTETTTKRQWSGQLKQQYEEHFLLGKSIPAEKESNV